ncbi:MAG: hypothetical protein ACRDSI_05730 [Pseudonocardiaceae bacterium]
MCRGIRVVGGGGLGCGNQHRQPASQRHVLASRELSLRGAAGLAQYRDFDWFSCGGGREQDIAELLGQQRGRVDLTGNGSG